MIARLSLGAVVTLAIVLFAGRALFFPADSTPPLWRTLDKTVAHNVMIVEIETDDADRSVEIARRIVDEASRERYDEVLIYVGPPGSPVATRRVQWTPRGGFTELVMDD